MFKSVLQKVPFSGSPPPSNISRLLFRLLPPTQVGVVCHSITGSAVPMNGFSGMFSQRSGHDRQGWASMKLATIWFCVMETFQRSDLDVKWFS